MSRAWAFCCVSVVCASAAVASGHRRVDAAIGGTEAPLVVLVPGFMGADRVMGAYFIGWQDALEAQGFDVVVTDPPLLASSEARGEVVAQKISAALAERTGVERVVIVAHSQGGVDARAAIDALPRGVVGAVATLSSPHHGTDVADTARRWPVPVVDAVLTLANVLTRTDHASAAPQSALFALSGEGMALFNEQHPARDDVPLFSFGAATGSDPEGACSGGRWPFAPNAPHAMHPLLFVARDMIAESRNVAQDGVVPTASMRFGNFMGCIAGHHIDWIGWSTVDDRFDERAFAVELVRALVDVNAGGAAAMEPHVPAIARLARASAAASASWEAAP